MVPLGPHAFDHKLDPHQLFTMAAATQDEEHAEYARELAYDLATIQNLPVVTEGIPEQEKVRPMTGLEALLGIPPKRRTVT